MGQVIDDGGPTSSSDTASDPQTSPVKSITASCGWPQPRPDQLPKIHVHAADFLHDLLFGEHLNEVIILRDGISKLHQEDAMPSWLMAAARDGDGSVRRFLSLLDPKLLPRLRSRVKSFSEEGQEKELYRDKEGYRLDTLEEKHEEMEACSELEHLYLAEFRWRQKQIQVCNGKSVKAITEYDVETFLEQKGLATPYWDGCYAGGFIGELHSGSAIHVDQLLTSNVGRNWLGTKLLALWEEGEVTRQVLEASGNRLLMPPYSEVQTELLRQCVRIAHIQAGDVFVFSGANAHMTLSVSCELSLTAYESFINFHPTSVQTFLRTGSERHPEGYEPEDEMLMEVKEEVASNLVHLLHSSNTNVNSDPTLRKKLEEAIAAFTFDNQIKANLESSDPLPCFLAKRPRTCTRITTEEECGARVA